MKRFAVGLIKLYRVVRVLLDPLLRGTFGTVSECKHNPSCSEYTIQQINQHGTMRGLFRGTKRVLSCH